MKQYRILAILITSLLVSGCVNDYIRDRGNDYLDAELYPETKVPEGIDGSRLNSALIIPERSNRPEVEEFIVPRPNAIVLASDDNNFRIEQDGSARWIVANRTPSELWPDLTRFWEESGMSLQVNDPSNGEMETDWTGVKDGEEAEVLRAITNVFGEDTQEMQEKYRLNVQQGLVAGSSEIHLLHARAASDDQNPTVSWGTNSDSDLMQSAMLNEILVFVSQSTEQLESVSLVARELEIGNRVSLVEDGNGHPVLTMDMEFGRSWAAVGRALEKTSVRVIDRDRNGGVYYLEIDPGEKFDGEPAEEEKPGFFSGLFGDDESDEERPASENGYQVRLTALGTEVKVSVEKSVTELAPKQISFDLLTLIKDNLS